MRSVLGTLGPLAVSLSLVGAVAACTATGSDDAGSATSPGASLAPSSMPTGSGSGSGSGSGDAGGGQVPVGPAEPRPVRGSVEVVRTLPHDPELFTQGLQVVGDEIYESTGEFTRSQVQRRPLAGGPPTVSVRMADDEFGEGLAVTPDTLWTLTWTNGIAHNRDPRTLEVRSEVPYVGEGWGLCYDGERLIMSNGSDQLTFRDPVTFEPTGTVSVTSGGTPVVRINELECADGTVLANVWMTDEVIRIDPATGAVTAIYDASALERPRPASREAVLNGIAALPGSENVLLTGKLWPTMYEVRLIG
ncbi:glutaminyl-peptide cyclotransferase [Dietzia sp. B19]|uniref:glutaminyl-peptide cyclotransferase n=1 Tax=Dietzia sp. B19 TaxID=1630632 RepID=UPI0015F963FC|nr:glutaminyl-peptide cyclotransferase [Dietzia sp. B19]MBB1056649.1 glutaminyl-peptide cyclotransferase [Dietzia sp. B19]